VPALRTENKTRDHPIADPKIRCAATRAIQNEELMLQQNRFRDDRAYTSALGNPENRNDDVEKNDDQIAHSRILPNLKMCCFPRN